MSILITGGAGYIGSQIAWTLADAGIPDNVVVLDRLDKVPCNLPTGVKTIMGDINDQDLVAKVIRQNNIDKIIHCAAVTSVPQSVRLPFWYYQNNVCNTHMLLSVAVRLRVKQFIFSSSSAVYGDPEFVRPMKEDDSLRPMSPYGWSKLMGEQIIKDTAKVYGFNYAILRFFNVAGADPQMRTGPTLYNSGMIFRVACETALGRRPMFDIKGTDYPTPDGTAVRDYVHVADVARAHVDMLEQGIGKNLILNVGCGHGYSVREILDALEAIQGAGSIPFRLQERRLGDPAKVIADVSALKQFGWTPHHDIRTIALHALRWERHLDPERD